MARTAHHFGPAGLLEEGSMTPPRLSLDDEILDLAVMWIPIGDPPADKIKRDFGIEPAEYRMRLAHAIDRYLQTSSMRTHARLDRFFETSLLNTLRQKHSPPSAERSITQPQARES